MLIEPVHIQTLKLNNILPEGLGGGLMDRVANSGLYDPSSIPLGEKKEIKQKRGQGSPIFKKSLEYQ